MMYTMTITFYDNNGYIYQADVTYTYELRPVGDRDYETLVVELDQVRAADEDDGWEIVEPSPWMEYRAHAEVEDRLARPRRGVA